MLELSWVEYYVPRCTQLNSKLAPVVLNSTQSNKVGSWSRMWSCHPWEFFVRIFFLPILKRKDVRERYNLVMKTLPYLYKLKRWNVVFGNCRSWQFCHPYVKSRERGKGMGIDLGAMVAESMTVVVWVLKGLFCQWMMTRIFPINLLKKNPWGLSPTSSRWWGRKLYLEYCWITMTVGLASGKGQRFDQPPSRESSWHPSGRYK